jgi:tetrapyrrole methylase family protein/MazG family protein
LDQAFLRFGFDPLDGFQLVDATKLDLYRFEPTIHAIFAQVYDNLTASDVKLKLMEWYPDDHPVVVGHALGVAGEEVIHQIPLYELDRISGYGNLSLVWVPKDEREHLRNKSFDRLHEIVAILRSPGGCPWDREQTHTSIRKNLIEETYEVLETIDEDDPDHMREELGDLLLQIMLHAQMEQEVGTFTVYDVIEALNEKLIRRHPHVFGDLSAGDAEEALSNWEAIKKEEKLQAGQDVERLSVLSGVPKDLPGLMKALKLQKKAAKVGFDWDNSRDVWAKLEEELQELREVMDQPGREEECADELGDLLFVIVNLARFLKVDPEEALARTNRKFIRRFSYIEEQLRLRGKTFDQTDLIEMEALWQEAKRL